MNQTAQQLAVAEAAIAGAARAAGGGVPLGEAELLQSTVLVESISRQLDVLKAQFAGQLSRLSLKEFGDAGLAARHGHLSPEAMLRSLTRTSFQEAARRIRVGQALGAPDAVLSPIAAAVEDGRLGIEGADRVIRTLTPIIGMVDPDALHAAVAGLAEDGATHHADDLGALARQVRDSLDRVSILDREKLLRSQRSLRKGAVVDGMRRVSLALDPESDAIIIGAIEAAMSPRLGGPRFTDPTDRERADRLVTDDRTNEQMALDMLVELVRLGVDHDDGTMLGTAKPALRVTISLQDLTAGLDALGFEHPELDTGAAWLEGSPEPLSASTARRTLCDAGALPIVLGGTSQPLDLGRPRRHFNTAQRVALAHRDGGCMFGDCDRPASWCEAHHLHPFGQGGPTDFWNGILLCRRHHLLLHNNGWRIERYTALPVEMPAGSAAAAARSGQAGASPGGGTTGPGSGSASGPGQTGPGSGQAGTPGTGTSQPSSPRAQQPDYEFVLIPPKSVDPAQQPRPMPSKTRRLRNTA